jgi:hypothetical protein
MAYTTLPTQSAGQTASAAGWANVVKANFDSMGPHLLAHKTVDESLTSNTTLQDDDALVQTGVGANAVWRLHWALMWDAGTAGDIKIGFTFPSGRIDFGAVGVDETGTPTFRRWNTSTSPAAALGLYGPAGVINYDIFGVFANGATPGDLHLQWAQVATSGTATIMKAHSTLWGVQLA